MSYTIDHTDIAAYGAVAARRSERIALEGIFSFPRRTGETERNWGTEIEPYAEVHEIEFEGRTLKLNVWLRGSTPAEYNGNLAAFKGACIACRTLSAGYADFAVVLKEEIKVEEYVRYNRARITATFWEQEVFIPALTFPASGGGGYLLDGFSLLRDFDIRVSKRQDNNSVGKRIEVNTTAPYTQTLYRDKTDIILQCYMRGSDYEDLYAKMGQFHALCARPGLRTLQFPDEAQYIGYLRDGFTVRAVHRTRLDFDFKLRVI